MEFTAPVLDKIFESARLLKNYPNRPNPNGLTSEILCPKLGQLNGCF
jgi:hypothetical protein